MHNAIRHVTTDNASIPLPIRQLAAIADFRLMVTVTPDDMLARCLRKRCSVNEIIHSPNFSPTAGPNALPEDWMSRDCEVHLLYLFGKSNFVQEFAIHEEDVLEYAHNMIARGTNVPTAFLAELQTHDLLFIGCRFPDWLSRFFLRATNKIRLSGARQKREWMIERLQPEESLTLFLKSHSEDTRILAQIEPAAFVDELHRRWMQLHSSDEPEKPVARQENPPRGATFFVSYSRVTDKARAESVVQALQQLGASAQEVWFDRNHIEPGNDFKERILTGIRGCRYFLPLLSDAATGREKGFVFEEWRTANECTSDLAREFVVPLIVDADYQPNRYTTRQVPNWPVSKWSGLDFGHAPDGVPDARTLTRLKTLLRQARPPAA